MAGLPSSSIQTVTAKVRLSQSSVLGNISLEDIQVSHGVSHLYNWFRPTDCKNFDNYVNSTGTFFAM